MYYYDIIKFCLFKSRCHRRYFGIFICFVIQINSVYFVYDDDVCGIEISSLPYLSWIS